MRLTIKDSWLIVMCGMLFFVPGCGSGQNTASYVPNDAAARDALTAALNAWKSGKKPGRIENTAVEVVDHQWQAGAQLRNYEILAEVQAEGPKRYRVRLTLDDSSSKEAIYVIVGRSPLWVFRQEDYQKVQGM